MQTLWIGMSVALILTIIFAFVLLLRYLSYRETVVLAEKGLVRPEKSRGDGKDSLRWGIILAAVGLALTLGLWLIGLSGTGTRYPLGLGPWMMFGFLPLFFGLGLVLIYVLTRDRHTGE